MKHYNEGVRCKFTCVYLRYLRNRGIKCYKRRNLIRGFENLRLGFVLHFLANAVVTFCLLDRVQDSSLLWQADDRLIY